MDILIFDMDGVLIDVSKSYRKTIQRTIQIYLENCLGVERGRRGWITDKEISLFKSVGGFNNDWDLTSGLLLYLLSTSGTPPLPRRKRFPSIPEVVSYLKTKSSMFQRKTTIRLKRKQLLSFLKKVKSKGGGLKGVRRTLGTSWEGWVYGVGDPDRENLSKRIFQEIYLGRMFARRYHLRPLFYKGQGLYLQERALIPRNILATLRKKVRMGIASGRPRFEAELALRRFHLHPYFDSVVTLNECEAEEKHVFLSTGKKIAVSKPHPYSILRVVRKIGIPNPYCAYVGDVVDDMLAARAARKYLQILAIGFLSSHRNKKIDRESLIKAGADLVVENPEQLLRFVSSPHPADLRKAQAGFFPPRGTVSKRKGGIRELN
jgi:HAD superfamily hydrolase (TIGR01548 family)